MNAISKISKNNGKENTMVSDSNTFSTTENPKIQNHENLFIQPKLTIGSPNDYYEQQADSIASQVMRMPETNFVSQRNSVEGNHTEEKVQRKPFNISQIIQKIGENTGAVANQNISNQIESSKGNGRQMDSGIKSFMESRIGNDFSNVKIHTDSNAIQLSQKLNAQAFTVGNDVFFNQGKYSPESDSGRHLLAHELAHTVQQGGGGSVGLAMRRIQRAENTWGGTWNTDQFDLKQDEANGTIYPAATGVRGVDIKLKFTPNSKVNAELIGLTQSVQAIIGGSPVLTPSAAGRAIPTKDAKSINTGVGETDEGTAIDRAGAYNNPIYPVSSLPSASLDDTTVSAGWGQLGWNTTTKTPPKQDATLIDTPRRSGAQKNARHVFETTALATKGVQAGTYYGSVRWGWRTDGAGAFTKIPLSVVSQGVPSSTFMKAAEIWNASKTSTGADTLDLPIVDVKVTTVAISEQVTPSPIMSRLARTIPAGTRVQIIFYGASSATGEMLPRIKVVDGAQTGAIMSISSADLATLADERS